MKKYCSVVLIIILIFITILTLTGCGGGNNDGGNSGGEITSGPSWTKQLGSSGVDVASGVAVDGVDNVYITGYTGGGLNGNTNTGSFDMFLVKYGPSGANQWTKQTGIVSVGVTARGVAVDHSGNVYVTGETEGGLDGNSSAGNTDIFLMKYDSAGAKQWTKQLGTSAVDKAYGVAVDGDGNVYITGETNGDLDGTNAGNYDVFLVKYDSLGTKQWTRQLGSSYSDTGSGVAVDGSGNIYITGSTAGGLDGNTNTGSFDMFLVKYDSSGVKQWTKQLGALNADYSNGVAVDGSGDIYITGRICGGIDGNTAAGGDDLLLVKYDSSGAKQWTKQLGSSRQDIPLGVAVDGGGNVYITGETEGGLDGNTNAGMNDIFLVKYDSAGTKQWTRQLGTSTNDIAYGVAVDGGGNVYVTGETWGGLDGNTNTGSYDIFLVKYDPAGVKQ